MKRALITGITGQDGAYLAQALLKRGYKVFGGERRTTTNKYWRLDELGITDQIEFVELDVIDQANIRRAIEKTKPDVIYNLAAQSFVALSFEQPELATIIDGLGVLRILECIKQVNPKIRFYQASTSEMFGKVKAIPQKETTPFHPRSPYGCAKLFGHSITVNYREAYNIFACSGILFNHESPLRGTDFITRKVTKGLAEWKKTGKVTTLGNLDAVRDWGHAEDFVEGMILMMEHNKPNDYVLATGKTHTVRDWISKSLKAAGINPLWSGNEVSDYDSGRLIFTTDKKNFRPAEVDILQGDSGRAKAHLGWEPKHTIDTLVKDMVEADMRRYAR
jgi:GDPmannose 4,6-dehydratase